MTPGPLVEGSDEVTPMKNGKPEYGPGRDSVNGSPCFVTGQWIAHAKLSLHERAYLAADLHTGVSLLVEPTIGQSADLARVNHTYASWAVKRPKDRQLIVSGVAPLVPPSAVKALPAPVDPVTQLTEVVSVLGVGGVMDALSAFEKGAA
jgi:hypothetical protein